MLLAIHLGQVSRLICLRHPDWDSRSTSGFVAGVGMSNPAALKCDRPQETGAELRKDHQLVVKFPKEGRAFREKKEDRLCGYQLHLEDVQRGERFAWVKKN